VVNAADATLAKARSRWWSAVRLLYFAAVRFAGGGLPTRTPLPDVGLDQDI
jgi:hypothetical protein